MKKNLLWMLAAILLCGSMTTALTACGDDDDDSSSPSSSANTYEVTLAALLPRCSAPYLQLQVNYTDANGKSESIVVKEGDQSQTLSSEAKDRYLRATTLIRNEERAKLIDDVIVRNITFRVPAGKSFAYDGTIVTRTDYIAPTEKTDMVQPCVISTAKRISGTSTDYSASAVNSSLSVTASFGIHVDQFAELLGRWNGRSVGTGTVTLE